MTSIRDRQIAALKLMLNLNKPLSKNAKLSEPIWKILIYDRVGQDIISPLLSPKELRELGVTVFAQLHSDRDHIPDVPAVYFVLPNDDNITRIGQDLKKGLYDNYHFNFISPISRQSLENLAESSIEANAVKQIEKVYDQYLNFISLENDLFILRQADSKGLSTPDAISYYGMNKGNVKDYEMDATIDLLVESLFAVFATLGAVPIIRCPRGNAAQILAEKLDKKLRENLRDSRNNLFILDPTQVGSSFSFQRPLLIILDRMLDMATPLHHTWTYQALAHDVLDLNLNRVVVEEPMDSSEGSSRGGAKLKAKTCQLDSNDDFWVKHKGSPFPTVAEAIQEELETIRSSEGKVKRLKESMGVDGDADVAFSLVNDNTVKLTSAINSLPELLEKKRLIDMHMTLATVVLNSIKMRRLDTLFEVEEKLMGRQQLDIPVPSLLADRDLGSADDKLRLFLIYYLCSPSIPPAELESCRNILEHKCGSECKSDCERKHNLAALDYLKRYVKTTVAPSQYLGSGTKTMAMFSKLVSQGSSFVMEGVKNLVVKKHNLPVTHIVDELMEQKQSQETEDYLYFDPKKQREDGVRTKTAFQEAVVFMVGGGNYIEYQNLVDYTEKRNAGAAGNKKIVYGASSLYNSKEFLRQLTMLGKEMKMNG